MQQNNVTIVSYNLCDVSIAGGNKNEFWKQGILGIGMMNGFSETRNQIVEARRKCHLEKTGAKSVGSRTLPESYRYANLSCNYICDKEIPTSLHMTKQRGEGRAQGSQLCKSLSRNPEQWEETYKILMKD